MAYTSFKFTKDPSDMVKTLSNMEAKQMPFAVSLAINQTLDEAVPHNQNHMKKVFDRPTPFTLNSLQRKKTHKKRFPMIGRLEFREFAGKGTPASKYLTPQIEGGGRRTKRHERRLSAVGKLPQGKMTAPAQGSPLNQYGNLTGAEYTKLLSQVQALGDQSMTRVSKMKKRSTFKGYYVAYKGNQPVGIRKRLSKNKSQKILNFIDPPNYVARYDFYDLNRAFMNKTFRKRISQTLAFAIRTAK